MGQPEVLGDLGGLFEDNSVWHEYCVDIASHAGSAVGQGHSGTADDKYIGYGAPADQALAKRGEGLLDLCPAEKNMIRPAHAASRSLAER